MPTIDDFIRPKEWVSEFLNGLGKVIRQWGEELYIPIRQQVDEDWREHKLIKPLMKEVLVDLGVNSAFFPAEVGGTEMPEPMALSNIVCEELARIDSGFATACICSIWGIIPNIIETTPQHGTAGRIWSKILRRRDICRQLCHDRARQRCRY